MARRYLELHDEIADLDMMIAAIVDELAPDLVARNSIGHTGAAQLLLTAGGNPERMRSEASFAALCGVSPVPASSGRTVRHRLNRGGDRAANSALHIIAIGRLRTDQRTKDYVARRIAEGHSKLDAIRALNRLFVEAVLYRYRAGIPWRDLPERFGDWKNVHRRFTRWAEAGVWERMFRPLAADADNEYAMIDSTIVRAHQHSAGAKKAHADQAIGRSRGGLSTKIHAMIDALGNPIGFHLTGGEAHDLGGADHLLPDMAPDGLIADKAFDADERVREPLAQEGKKAVIPPRAHRKEPPEFGHHLYKERHLIENFFTSLKQYRAIATRYDKTARNFLAAIHLAAAVIWLN